MARPLDPAPPVPRYGEASLPDLAASALSALGVAGEPNALDIPPLPHIAVLLVDGLGWRLLGAHSDAAPFLATLLPRGRPLTSGFPATTATSLGCLGTGRPPGGHGMLGYQVAVPGSHRLLNCLRFDDSVDPARWQPTDTVYERARSDGVAASYVGPREFADTGLTRAVVRGSRYLGVRSLGELAARALRSMNEGPRTYTFIYYGELDATGHRLGCGSDAWRLQLGFVDRLVEQVADGLPHDSALYVTADHGMVDVTERVDVDELGELTDGVELLGGEARARHVYATPGRAGDVLAAWREVLGEHAWVVSRQAAVESGWFGTVDPRFHDRIGDVVAVARGAAGIVATRAEPGESRLVGMHGSLEDTDLLVPMLSVVRE